GGRTRPPRPLAVRGPAFSRDEDVVAGPAAEHVQPGPADQHVIAGAAEQGIVPLAADQHVVAGAAVLRKPDRVGGQAGGIHHVVARQGVDDKPVVGGLGAGDVHRRGQATYGHSSCIAGDADHLCATGPIDKDGVGFAVAPAAAGNARQVDVHLGHGGAGQVVDDDGVSAAECGDVDLLHAVHVHDDVADVAGEPQPRAVGGGFEGLVDVGAVELQGVVTALALDRVAVLAPLPHEPIAA